MATGQHHEFGNGIVVGRGTGTNPQATIFGTTQEVSIDLGGDLARLTGQYEGIVDAARKGVKISGKIKFAKFNGRIVNDLFWNSAAGIVSGSMKTDPFVAKTVPAPSGPYTVTITPPSSGTFAADLGVVYQSTGAPLKRVTSVAAVGEYSVNEATGVYTFYSGDASADVYISYDYTLTTGYRIELDNKVAGNAPTFELRLDQSRNGYGMHMWLYSCVASKLTFPYTNEDFSKKDIEFEAIPNAANRYGRIYWDDLSN